MKTSERGHTHTYPFNIKSYNGHHELRTNESFTENAKEAECTPGKNVFGVKGLTWFSFLPWFDMVRGVAVDYMHCITLGIVKMIMSLWFDKSYKNEIFSIASEIGKVERRLISIKPPSYITRLPRSLSEVSHFKATEFKNFLLFYSLPCLYGILPDDMFHHFSLLVYSIFLLLQENITPSDILACKRMLLEFVINIPVFYGERYMTSNVHLLLHLTDKVEDLGPLWASSCFYFEDFNGQLRRLFHGTQHVERQIAFAVCVHQQLPSMSSCLQYGTSERELFYKLSEKKSQTITEEICEGISVVGAFTNQNDCLNEDFNHAVFLAIGPFSNYQMFKRAQINRQIVHSKKYHAVTRRDNTIVKYNDSFGQVEIFLKVYPTCTSCNKDCVCSSAQYLAILNKMKHAPNVLPNLERSSRMCHMVAVQAPMGDFIAVQIKEITNVCVSVSASENLCFVSARPNRVERE